MLFILQDLVCVAVYCATKPGIKCL